MTSLYGIITTDELEADGTDYSAISSKYTDAVLEEWISMAESFVCLKLNAIYDSSANNTIIYIVKTIARQIAKNKLITDQILGYKDQQTADPYSLDIVKTALDSLTNNTLQFSFGFASHSKDRIYRSIRGDGN